MSSGPANGDEPTEAASFASTPRWDALWQNVGFTVLAIAGAAIGAAVLLGDAVLLRVVEGDWRGRTPLGTNYTGEVWTWLRRPEGTLWLALLVGGTALWACLLPGLVASLHRWGRPRGLAAVAGLIALFLLITIFVVTPRLAGGTPSAVPGHFVKIVILTFWGFATALLSIGAMWSVQAHAAGSADIPVGRRLTLLLELRQSLASSLASMGAILGAAILATGALMNARRAAGDEAAPELVLLYGGSLSLLIGLVYIPVWRQVQTTGEALADELAPVPDPADGAFADKLERRSALRALLDLDLGVTGSFRAGVSILAPLASGLVTLLLP